MQIIVNNQIIDTIIKPLNLEHSIVRNMELIDLTFTYDDYGRYYVEKRDGNKEKATVIDLTNDSIYKLDVFESSLDFKKQSIENETFAYYKLNKNSQSEPLSIEEINNNFAANKGMNHCDLNLLIPCKTKKSKNQGDFTIFENEISSIRAEKFSEIIKDEFESDYLKQIRRFTLGELCVYANDEKYRVRGYLEIAYHDETRLCVLEIYMPNISLGANKILDKYLANKLFFKYNNTTYESIESLLECLQLRSFGKRRSMVFCDSNVTTEEIVNTLANEEAPMAKIGGAFLDHVLNGNIAVYDTAKVYISNATMIEVMNDFNENYLQRLEYEVLETFFVELILLEDAAMDKIYKDLIEAQNSELKTNKKSSNVIDKISFDMSKAKRFADFESIRFPTVRESAYKIAKCFGIELVFNKYEENKSILQEMIEVNKRKIEDNENEIKNNFLFLISAISMYGMISGVFNDFVGDIKVSYILSLIVVTLAYIIYRYLLKKHKGSLNE